MEGSLWAEARDALAGIADVATRYDADGVDIHFLNSPTIGRHMKVSVSWISMLCKPLMGIQLILSLVEWGRSKKTV